MKFFLWFGGLLVATAAGLQAQITMARPVPPPATQAEAEEGTSTQPRVWSPERIAQAIAALGSGGSGSVLTGGSYGDSTNNLDFITDISGSKVDFTSQPLLDLLAALSSYANLSAALQPSLEGLNLDVDGSWIFNVLPRVPWEPLTTETALTVKHAYKRPFDGTNPTLTFSGSPADADAVWVLAEVGTEDDIGIPSSFQLSTQSTITSLTLPVGTWLLAWKYDADGTRWLLTDTLPVTIAASSVAFSPAGTIASTNVQAAIEEAASEGGGGGAPTDAHYLTTTTEAGLSAEANLGALTTGLLKISVSGGTATPSTAAAGTDYAPATSGSSILKGNGSGGTTAASAGTDYVAPGGALGTPSSGNASNMTVDGTNSVGFRNVPQNSQSAAYTFVLADAGKHILHPTADNNPRTYTIPANASVAYPIGTAITVVNQINTVTIAITSDTLTWYTGGGTGSTGSRTLAAGGVATLMKISSTSWIITGPGVS